MARYRGTIDAPRSAEEVWHYLADLRSVGEWDPSVERVDLVAGEPRSDTARYRLSVRFGGREVTVPYRTARVEPPRRIVFEAETKSASIRDLAIIEPTGPRTSRVTWDAELRLRGLRRAFDPLLRPLFSRIGRNAERGLAANLAKQGLEEPAGRAA